MSIQRIPRGFLYAGLILLILAMIPPALIARVRAVNSELPRIHLMQDMSIQHRFNAQQANPMFRDRRAMRPIVPGTVAQGELYEDDHYYRGLMLVEDEQGEFEDFVTTFPTQIIIDRRFLERGRDRYDIFCQICHGKAGYGDGMVNERGLLLQAGAVKGTTWITATNLHEPQILDMPVGQLYNVVAHGARTMPEYGSMIPVEDRWAIVAYVRALQRSQSAEVEVLGPIEQSDVDFEEGSQEVPQ